MRTRTINRALTSAATVVVMLLLVGCHVEQRETGDDDASAETVALYEKDRGLLLPPDVRASLGVTFAEVGESTPIRIPKLAVIDGVMEQFVYVENGEHIVRTPVATGASDEAQIEVTEGLVAGDRVVTAGAHDLWMTELLAIRGGSPCCPVPKKEKK